jgi:mono/diheme cytochrome c family protein
MLCSQDSSAWLAQQQRSGTNLKDPRLIAEGAKLFAPTCGTAYCHGANGDGGGAPRLRGKDLDSQYVFKTIANGVSGTAMPAFKSDFSEDQIWRLVAFVLSEGTFPPAAEATSTTRLGSQATASNDPPVSIASTVVIGDAQAGKLLFYDSSQQKSCHVCHAISGEGGSVGPDLSSAAGKRPRELFSAILMARSGGERYAALSVSTKGAEKVIGIKKDEDSESVRVFDVTELPPVLRTFQKSDISKSEPAVGWNVHRDNATLYTIRQLLDLISFLKSPQSKAPVSLDDIL